MSQSNSARSFLFVPASNLERVAKAVASRADAVIVDLEDAVAITEKSVARANLQTFFAQHRPDKIWVRVNDLRTEWAFDDLYAVADLPVEGVVLPKCEAAADIATAAFVLGRLGQRQSPIVPIIETAKGLRAVDEIARAGVARMLFGAVDLAADMDLRLSPESEALKSARYQVALASRAAGIGAPIDTAFADIANEAELRETALTAASFGYGAKCCIHPKQLAVVHEVFSPTPAQVEWAEGVVAAFRKAEAEGLAAIQLNGAMIDYPVAKRAEMILSKRREM